MRKLLLCACAALLMLVAPAEVGAQVFFYYKDLPAMALDNESVGFQVSVKPDSYSYAPTMHVRIKNKTERTLYIDLGNTFLTVNDDSRSYYVPSSTATTEGRVSGASVNLGLVNVGGGVSSSETTTVFSQRVLAVPPMSSKNLEVQHIIVSPIPEMAIYCNPSRVENGMVIPRCQLDADRYPRVPEGETWTFGPDDENTLTFSVMVTCSFEESCAETFTLRRGYYVDRTACYKDRPGMKFWDVKDPLTMTEKGRQMMSGVFPEWESWGDYFMLYSYKSWANSLVE